MKMEPVSYTHLDVYKRQMLLYAVTDRAWVGKMSLYEQVEATLQNGATCIPVSYTHLKECFALVQNGGMKKGDVLSVARIAGIMGAKKTSDLIPLCHILNLTKVEIDFGYLEEEYAIEVSLSLIHI